MAAVTSPQFIANLETKADEYADLILKEIARGGGAALVKERVSQVLLNFTTSIVSSMLDIVKR